MKGRKIYAYLVATCCLLVMGAAILAAQGEEAPEWTTGLDLSVYSRYVWRGITLTDDPVLQPSLTFKHANGFTSNIWGNMDLGDANDMSGEFNELDYTVDYSWTSGPTTMSAGLIYYTFPNTDAGSTAEVYFGAGVDAPLSPSLTVYYDFKEVDGYCAKFGIGHCINIPMGQDKGSPCDLGLSVGYGSSDYNAAYFGPNDGGFNDLTLSASTTFDLNKRLSLTPSINYSTIIDSDLGDALEAGGIDDSAFYVGVTFSFAF